MPNDKWKHRCPESGGAEIILGIEICDRCGQRGDYIGWGHSMVEAMAAYHRRMDEQGQKHILACHGLLARAFCPLRVCLERR